MSSKLSNVYLYQEKNGYNHQTDSKSTCSTASSEISSICSKTNSFAFTITYPPFKIENKRTQNAQPFCQLRDEKSKYRH